MSQRRRLTLLLGLLFLAGCATTPPPLQPHDILRLETCLATVAHLDPGAIDGVSDAALEQAVQIYADTFAKTDIMAMGRDPDSPEVRYAAFRALLYQCWRQDQLPPSDPLRHHPPPPPAW